MKKLLIANVLPENNPTVQSAIRNLKSVAAEIQIFYAYRKTFVPVSTATPAVWKRRNAASSSTMCSDSAWRTRKHRRRCSRRLLKRAVFCQSSEFKKCCRCVFRTGIFAGKENSFLQLIYRHGIPSTNGIHSKKTWMHIAVGCTALSQIY